MSLKIEHYKVFISDCQILYSAQCTLAVIKAVMLLICLQALKTKAQSSAVVLISANIKCFMSPFEVGKRLSKALLL